ncbi:MAG: HAMP domain-containing sensor histidine kinase, partial [Bacteroidota bacterium]
ASPYQACLNCVITIQFLNDSTRLPETEFTSMRPVAETETEIPGQPRQEEFYFLSLYLPEQALQVRREIIRFFLLTLVLTLLLVGVFAYILRMLNQQKKLSQAKDDFFNNLTHEFMTPLSSIRLAARMLKAQLKESKPVGYLDLIERESQQLEGQVDKILQLSLLESHRDSLDKEQIDLHEVVQAVLDRLQLHINQKQAKVQVDLSLSDSMYWGDFDQLVNAIYNLLDNALKYAGPQPEILLISRLQAGRKQILVRDLGPGIPMAEQTEIFERFYRSQKGDQYQGKGFGIGLSYVKAIAEAHGGSLQLNPDYRDGCEFILSL